MPSVDEADARQTEREYPAQKSQDDNDVLDSIAFAPSMATMTPRQARTLGTKAAGMHSAGPSKASVVGAQVQSQRKVHRCKLCGASFEWASRLQTHMAAHKRSNEEGSREVGRKDGKGEAKSSNEGGRRERQGASKDDYTTPRRNRG